MSIAAILIAIPDNEPPADLEALIAAAEEGIAAGHGLHWLFTGTADEGDEPWCYLLKGGTEMTIEDMVDSVPRFLDRHQVDAWHQALQSVTKRP